MKFLQIKIDDKTHKQFKQKCLDKDVGMSEKIREWIEKWIKRGE